MRKSRKIAQMIRRLIGDLRKDKTISVDVAKQAYGPSKVRRMSAREHSIRYGLQLRVGADAIL